MSYSKFFTQSKTQQDQELFQIFMLADMDTCKIL